jgi:hypothetical protein
MAPTSLENIIKYRDQMKANKADGKQNAMSYAIHKPIDLYRRTDSLKTLKLDTSKYEQITRDKDLERKMMKIGMVCGYAVLITPMYVDGGGT